MPNIGLNLKLVSQQQHIRCLCNTESHRNTHHSGHDRQQQDSRGFSKSSWMMVAGAGLFSYSVNNIIHIKRGGKFQGEIKSCYMSFITFIIPLKQPLF